MGKIFTIIMLSIFFIPLIKMLQQCLKIKTLEATEEPVVAKLISEKDFGKHSSFTYEYYHNGQRKTFQKSKSYSKSEIIIYIDPKNNKVYDKSELGQSLFGALVLGVFLLLFTISFIPFLFHA